MGPAVLPGVSVFQGIQEWVDSAGVHAQASGHTALCPAHYNQAPKPSVPVTTAGGWGYMSTQRASQPLSCSNPSVFKHKPLPILSPLQTQHTQECTLLSKLLPSWTSSGGRRGASPQSRAVLQFLLLKHWFQMVLDTKMEKSKPPCETSFQKKRISLKKEGRCNPKTQPLSRGKCLLTVHSWHDTVSRSIRKA